MAYQERYFVSGLSRQAVGELAADRRRPSVNTDVHFGHAGDVGDDTDDIDVLAERDRVSRARSEGDRASARLSGG
jgi:hypothetical protein